MSDQTERTIEDVVANFVVEIEGCLPEPEPGPRRIVFQRIQPSSNRDNGKVLEPFLKLEARPLALHHCNDLMGVRKRLVAEFPYAENIIDALLKPAFRNVSRGDAWIRIEPTIIVGLPGLGKTRLVRRLCDMLGVGHEVASAAGAGDDLIFGLSRGWGTAQPSIMAELCLRFRCANPVLIIDEIDKTSPGRFGDFLGKLLPLLERNECKKWRDPFLCGELDLSAFGWLFTANEVTGLPAPLRSRVRVLEMRAPAVEHLPRVIRSILADLTAEEDLDARWYSGLDSAEMSAIVQSYGHHRSVRVLREQIRRVVDLRDVRMH